MRTMPPWARLVAVAVAATVTIVGVTTLVRASDGAFSGDYALSGMFSKAGTGLHPGSEVTYDGVQVGRVTAIALLDRQAQVSMAIQPTFRVPSDATAVIRPLNVFGAEEVAFTFPGGDSAGTLAAGSTIGHTAVSAELGDLFAAADPLLESLDTTDLSTVVSTLAQASNGEGPTVAASIEQGAELADLLDRTLPAQLRAIDSFNGFTAALAPTGATIDALSAAEDEALPTFNANSRAYANLLAAVTPFADDLAAFLAAYRPDIQTLLASGDNVARVLLARQSDVGLAIKGAAIYLTKFANAIDPTETLPDGSHFAYFHTFIELSDLNDLICGLIAPSSSTPGLSFLAPLQQALSGAGTPLDCSSQISAFDLAQGLGGSPSSAPGASQAAQALSTQTYQSIASPQGSTTGGLGGLIGSLLGGSSGSGSGGSSSSGGGLGGLLP